LKTQHMRRRNGSQPALPALVWIRIAPALTGGSERSRQSYGRPPPSQPQPAAPTVRPRSGGERGGLEPSDPWGRKGHIAKRVPSNPCNAFPIDPISSYKKPPLGVSTQERAPSLPLGRPDNGRYRASVARRRGAGAGGGGFASLRKVLIFDSTTLTGRMVCRGRDGRTTRREAGERDVSGTLEGQTTTAHPFV